tara:strand:+ start:1245 stop:1412 length:168 start_codon:yes stop_codon:yes gene_type:complete
MATKRKTTPATPQKMGEGAIKDLIQSALRHAFGDHARELEVIFKDIDKRLSALEK